LQANGVQVYHFPTDDETVQEINNSMNTHVPFAVVGSTEFVKLGSKMIRARQYPWVKIIKIAKYFQTSIFFLF
jgi:septin 6/8/11